MSGIRRIVASRFRGNTHNAPPASKSDAEPVPKSHQGTFSGSSTPFRKQPGGPATPYSASPLSQSAPTAPNKPQKSSAFPQSHSSISFRLACFPIPQIATLVQLLQDSTRVATIKKADAERYSLVTALENARDLSVVTRVVERYVPYALTLWDISETLKAKGTNIAKGIVWTSALIEPSKAEVTFNAGFGFEAVMSLSLFAVNKLRHVLETEADFGMQSDQTIIEQIKSAQVAAGVFAYLRDTVSPAVIADFDGTPPPELLPDTSAMLYSLSLCIAQTLHTRRAALRETGVALLAKLSVAACDLANDALEKYDACVSAGVSLNSNLKFAAEQLRLLSRGWSFQYVGLSTVVTEQAGIKICAIKAAIETLQTASNSLLIGKVAAIDLDMLKRERDEAIRANAIVHQKAIPDVGHVPLPPGRALGAATKFEAPRIAAGERRAQLGKQ